MIIIIVSENIFPSNFLNNFLGEKKKENFPIFEKAFLPFLDGWVFSINENRQGINFYHLCNAVRYSMTISRLILQFPLYVACEIFYTVFTDWICEDIYECERLSLHNTRYCELKKSVIKSSLKFYYVVKKILEYQSCKASSTFILRWKTPRKRKIFVYIAKKTSSN